MVAEKNATNTTITLKGVFCSRSLIQSLRSAKKNKRETSHTLSNDFSEAHQARETRVSVLGRVRVLAEMTVHAPDALRHWQFC
jgi:hypothetical protein